jgi:hypothetical protein
VAEVDWDDAALESFLADVEDYLLPRLAAEVADVARALAPVRVRVTGIPKWAKHGYVGMGGRLKASVQWDIDRDDTGLHADVAALWYGRFLDPKARQLHRLHPFLPTALYAVLDGRTFRL